MGFCGCSLYTSTITAGILTLFDCIIYLVYDILVLIAIASPETLDGNNNKFNKILHYGFKNIESKTVVIILLGIRIAIRAVWFVSAICLLQGNSKEYRRVINCWKIVTVVKIVFSIATSIYALVKLTESVKDFSDQLPDFNENSDNDSFKLAAEFIIFIDFLELSPIWLLVFIALIIYVHQRSIEIYRRKTQLNQFGNSSPYSHNHNHNQNGVSNGHQNNRPQTSSNSVAFVPQPYRLNAVKLDEQYDRKASTTSSGHLVPNINVDDVITIPRVRTPTPPKDYDVKSNIKSFETRALSRNPSNVSGLAKRNSYLFNDSKPDGNEVRKTNSYYGQRPVHANAYINRAYDNNSELFQPISINRPKLNDRK